MSHDAFAYITGLKRCPDGSPLLPAERVVAMVLGDFYQDDGAFPSIDLLTDKCGLADRRRCQRLLDALVEKRLVVRSRPESQGRGHLTCYRFPEFDTPQKGGTPDKKGGSGYHPFEEQQGERHGDRLTDEKGGTKGGTPDEKGGTKGGIKGGKNAVVYKDELELEQVEPERAQAPRGLVPPRPPQGGAPSDQKPSLAAGAPTPHQTYGDWLNAKVDSSRSIPPEEPSSRSTVPSDSVALLMPRAQAWVHRYAPGSKVLESQTEETLAAIGDWDDVQWWLNKRVGEPVYMRRDSG